MIIASFGASPKDRYPAGWRSEDEAADQP